MPPPPGIREPGRAREPGGAPSDGCGYWLRSGGIPSSLPVWFLIFINPRTST